MTPQTNVADFLIGGKERSRVALRLLSSDHTYGELHAASAEVARCLVEFGLTRGDRVLLVAGNSLFWVAGYLGILHAGLVCVPLPTTISPEEFRYILHSTEAKAALLDARFAIRNCVHLDNLHVVTDEPISDSERSFATFSEVRHKAAGSEFPLVNVDGDDIAALMFTSGTTGRPRGVMVSHANIIANTESIIASLHLTQRDRIMAVLPFHYCFGTSLLHTHLRVNGSLVIDSRFMYAETVFERMIETECTGFAGVPSHFQILLRSSGLHKKTFPNLRYVQQAGGHLAPSFIRRLQQALPQAQIFIMYGQTEATARLSCLSPEFLDSKLGSIGKGLAGVNLRVVNESGTQVKPSEVGEIVAEGANVALGYWRAPEETAKTFRNGTLHTGDLATVDEDGFIYVVDRARDFVKCGGTRVACRQVEDKLLECGQLVEAAVIGTPDEVLGEAVKAFVVPRAPNRPGIIENIQDFCRKNMHAQLVPREIILLQMLPKNSAGKVLKQDLRAM